MNRDDIIRMAHEAGWSGVFVIEWAKQPDEHPVEKSLPVPVTMEQIERFFRAAYAAGAAAEREACAKIVETHQCTGWGILSAAIRARSKE
jgi:hypothetical protein